MALTGKQAAFVESYLRTRNATKAARDAGYGGDENVLAVTGYENLRNPKISEAISLRIKESCMSADEVLERLGAHARGDVKDFLTTTEQGVPVFDFKGAIEQGKTHLLKKMKTKTKTYVVKGTTAKDDESETDEGLVVTETDVEFELYDAQAALVHIGKHHKLFTEQQDVKVTGKMVMVNWTDERQTEDSD